jgi:hypothetical protein
VSAARNERAPARTETSTKPSRRRWREVAAALETRDAVAIALEQFLSGAIDAPEFSKVLESAPATDRAKGGPPTSNRPAVGGPRKRTSLRSDLETPHETS